MGSMTKQIGAKAIMERINQQALSQSTRPSAITTQRQSETLDGLLELLEQMKTRYEKPVDEQNDRLWLEALSKYPLATVREALKSHMSDPTIRNGFPVCRSFPMEGEVIERIERMRPQKSTYRDPRKPYACEKCQDTGYAYIPQGQSKETKVERCQCKRRSA
jgi:hypothetical protein